MSLVFAAIVPHTPLLIPSIGKDDFQYLKKTMNAYTYLEEELYVANPKTIIIITPRQKILDDSFSINLFPKYKSNFIKFGDFATKKEYKNDINLTHHIKEELEGKTNINLFSEEELDYGSSVPLYHLIDHLKEPFIIPIGLSNLDNTCHFNFGKQLKNIILNSNKRIAIIASAELSHGLSKTSQNSYSLKGEIFDQKIITGLKEKNEKNLLRIDKKLEEEAQECGLNSILILLGILNKINYAPEILSYEFPFGVGYLTTNFKLK
ncbi:MEMO1 family protein [Patescibacteria group bacterium]